MRSLAVTFIQWKDSETETGWTAYEPAVLHDVTTVGLLVEELEDHYVLAHSVDPATGEYNGLIRIPRSAVTKARTLCRIQVKSNGS